jgi:hypothetical protein
MAISISGVLAEIRAKVLEIRQQPKPEVYTEDGYLRYPEPWGGNTVYPQPDVLPEIEYDWRDEDKS